MTALPTAAPAAEHPAAPAPGGGSRPSRRRLLPVVGGAAVVAVCAATAAGLGARHALAARDHLLAADAAVAQVRAQLGSGAAGDAGALAAAPARLRAVQAQLRAAHTELGAWQIGLAAHLPVVGRDVRAVRTATTQADVLAAQVAPPLLDLVTGLSSGGSGRVAVLAHAAPTVAAASARADGAQRALDRIGTRGLAGPVAGAVTRLDRAAGSLAGALRTARTATAVAGPLLGAGGPRRYLVVFQNLAEARGTGGLPGAYAVLRADGRDVQVQSTGALQDLRSPARMPLDLGPGYRTLYGDDPRLWQDMDMSPDWRQAARLMLAAWQQQHGERLDGVIGTDPVALGYLLGATGPVTLADGTRLQGRDVAPLALSGVYRRWPGMDQDGVRDAYLESLSVAVFDRLLHGTAPGPALLPAARRVLDEHRLLAYSTDPAEQRRLEATPLAGALPTTDGPFLAATVNQANPGKLDWYLERSVRYDLGCARDGRRRTRVEVTLHSSAPRSGLSPYVAGVGEDAYRGWEILTVYGTRGARLTGVQVGDDTTDAVSAQDQGRPAWRVDVELPAGATRTVVLDLVEPARPGDPVVWTQPLARPQQTRVVPQACTSS